MDLHNILVPTDFSTYADNALQEALTLATRDKTHVLLLHILPTFDFVWTADWGLAQTQLEDKIQADAEQRLAAMAASPTISLETLVLWGDPCAEICRLATVHRSDLIVMSTHGRTGLAHVFIGSVAERVVRYAPCAVLITRAFQKPQQ